MNLRTPASILTVKANELPETTGAYDDFLVSEGDQTRRLDRADLMAEIEGAFTGEIPAPYATRAAMIAATAPAGQTKFQCYHLGELLTYRRDASIPGTPAATMSGGTVNLWPSGKITVAHWGAVGDGTTPDRAPVQGALDYATHLYGVSGIPQQVWFGEGTYLIEANQANLTASSVILRGAGDTATVIYREDFTGRGTYALGNRLDALVVSEVGGTFEAYDLTFRGEFDRAYTEFGENCTVAYRFGGGNQWEGFATGGRNELDMDGVTPIYELNLGPSASSDDGAYVDHTIHFYKGVGSGQITTITAYNGTSKVATLSRLLFGAVPDTTSKVHIGRNPPGMGLRLIGLKRVRLFNVGFEGLRNQACQITDCTDVLINSPRLYKCARGGISGRRNERFTVLGAQAQFVSDDVIFNAHEGTTSGRALYTHVSGGNFVDCQGLRFIGARNLTVANNTFVRPITLGLMVGFSGRQTPINQNSITIVGNSVTDIIARNSIAYEEDVGTFSAFRIATTSSMGTTDFRVPGISYSGAGRNAGRERLDDRCHHDLLQTHLRPDLHRQLVQASHGPGSQRAGHQRLRDILPSRHARQRGFHHHGIDTGRSGLRAAGSHRAAAKRFDRRQHSRLEGLDGGWQRIRQARHLLPQ
jgi:hypothetical protein